MTAYTEFLKSKRLVVPSAGRQVSAREIHPKLFDFQRDITRWALRKGRAAIFADCGLGKTFCQLEWARLVGGRALIVAPLSVARQTVGEAAKLGLEAHYTRSGDDLTKGINITNYEMVERFDASDFASVVLDESSILKGLDGKTRRRVTEMFAETPYRLCCTATPAPNDIAEIANHAEFLGIMTRAEMLAAFFVHDDKGWRLKGHAREGFFRWLASWGMSIRKPSDLGYSDEGFILPDLDIRADFVRAENAPEGQLFWGALHGLSDRIAARRATIRERAERAAEIINSNGEQWIAWVGLNDEGRMLAQLVPDSALQEGADSPDKKLADIEAFQDGRVRVLITKPRIAGFGMNLQNCANMVFVGLGDSYEQYYQCVRRCWRFGQTKPVTAHIVLTDMETEIRENVLRKEAQAAEMTAELLANVSEFERAEIADTQANFEYAEDTVRGDGYVLMLGDSAEKLREIDDESIGLSVFSPPFISLYTYSPTERDLGNCRTEDEFFGHFGFIIDELLRVTMPGRNCCVHVAQVPAMLSRDGYIGLKDFRGQTIQAFEQHGWIYHGEVCIDKDPQPLLNGTPVLTPQGWVPVEKLQVGDQVIGVDGKGTEVIDIPFQGEQPLYKLTFDDGAAVTCGPGHLWAVRTSSQSPWKTVSAKQLLDGGVRTPSGRYRYEVPVMTAAGFDTATPLPLHPRLLGAFLADGSWDNERSIGIAKDKELIEGLPLPEGHRVRLRPGSERAGGRTAAYSIICDEWHRNDVIQALRDLGLSGHRAWEKFIPERYLIASTRDRRELLMGLLDGDGKISPRGSIWYRTTSDRLADDVVMLVNSLGGLATARKREGGKYENKQGRPIWEISIRMNGDWCPFSLERKARHWRPGRRGIKRHIVSVDYLGVSAPCTCISVAAEDGLFVIDGHVVTHNSQAIRTKSKALLFVQLRKDSSWLRPALADYILVFRKPGENPVPIQPDITNDEWIEWARPIWYGIRETDTLNAAAATETEDERHICPLQLGTIERCVRLWSNPGETILSPFAGIGSEGYVALKAGRKFAGIELKPSYWQTACGNLERALSEGHEVTLFDNLGGA